MMDVGAFGTCVSWIVRDPHRQLHSTPKDLCWQPSSFSKNSGKNLFPLENSMHIISKKCKGSCYRSCICLFPLLIHLSNLGAKNMQLVVGRTQILILLPACNNHFLQKSYCLSTAHLSSAN